MNLVSMLYSTVTPLSEYNPERTKKPKKSPHVRSTMNANIAKHQVSVDRYKSVMKSDWVATVDIESRLGTGRGCVLPTLAKWEKKGFVARRKKGEPNSWTRNVGYEWKLKGVDFECEGTGRAENVDSKECG